MSLYCDITPEVTVFSVQLSVSFVAFETPVNVYSPKYITLRLQAINFLLPCSAEAVTVLILPCSAKVMYCLTKNFHVATNPYERFCLPTTLFVCIVNVHLHLCQVNRSTANSNLSLMYQSLHSHTHGCLSVNTNQARRGNCDDVTSFSFQSILILQSFWSNEF